MNGTVKFAIGAAAATCLAWGTHAASGAGYIGGLERSAEAALMEGGFDGVSVDMEREPLARIAVLQGVKDPQRRAEIEAALAASDVNLAGVRWGDGAALAGAGSGGPNAGRPNAEADTGSADAAFTDPAASAGAAPGATAQQVQNCQSDVNAFMDGKTITFRSGSAYLPDSSLKIVDGVAEKLAACSGMNVAVGGHTDATGPAEINQILSQARADAVSAALAERGVDAARITAAGYGSTKPLVKGGGANKTNRRIEFDLTTGSQVNTEQVNTERGVSGDEGE